jgi:hypothetical protein
MLKIEVNLDDISGELLGHLIDRLLAAGARDAFYIPIYMKKNRPAVMLQVLCGNAHLVSLCNILFRETTTFGLRYTPMTVHRLARTWHTVQTPWGDVRIKQGSHAGAIVQRAPEYEDCLAISGREGIPLKDVFAIANVVANADSPLHTGHF